MKKIIFNCVLFITLLSKITAANDNSIFILNSFHPEFRLTSFEVSGIRTALTSRQFKGNVYIEYLDTKNFLYENIAPLFYEFIKQKYRSIKFDIVLCTDNEALNFCSIYGKYLFPKAVIVFCGVSPKNEQIKKITNKITGVFSKIDYDGNIQLIKKIFPNTKEIVSFFDGTASGKIAFEEYKQSIVKYNNLGIKFVNYINPSIDHLIELISKLKDGQVVLQGEFSKDKYGVVFNQSAITTLITEKAEVPVFGCISDLLTKGIIGGKLLNIIDQGRTAGKMVNILVNGKPLNEIRIVDSLECKYYFDYRMLNKFNVDTDLLPQNSIIVHKPVNIWTSNKDLFIKIIVGFVVLIGLVFILSLNIIAKKRVEKELNKSKYQIDKILYSIADCVWSIDLDPADKIINSYFSPVVEKIFGYPAQYFYNTQKRLEDLVVADDKHIVMKAYRDLFNNISENVKYVFRIKMKNNKIKWIEQNVTMSKNELGGSRFDGISKDITKSIEQEELFFRFLKAIEQSPISVMITNTKGLIEYVNPHFENTSGYKFEEIKNKNPRFLKNEYTKSEDYKDMWETITAGKEWKGELLNKKKNGSYYWDLTTITSIKNDEGQITHYLAVKEDITHIKKVENELIKAKENAEKSDKLKDIFLAQMSHEIRTPLNAIVNISEILKEELQDNFNDEIAELFDSIKSSANRIIRTVHLIINMSELQTGTYVYTPVYLDFAALVNKILDNYLGEAVQKNVKVLFKNNLSNSTIFCDKYSTEQIVEQLIDNAIKFTDHGEINISITINKYSELRFMVKDTGIGISEEYLPSLYQAFSQEDKGYSRKYDGTGLGLALTKKYCELNNADILCNSTKGIGTEFIIVFNNAKVN
ncbi:MAG: ABC transporter substrate binding protein [bacterium]